MAKRVRWVLTHDAWGSAVTMALTGAPFFADLSPVLLHSMQGTMPSVLNALMPFHSASISVNVRISNYIVSEV